MAPAHPSECMTDALTVSKSPVRHRAVSIASARTIIRPMEDGSRPIAKRHHTVPQFYLRGFARANKIGTVRYPGTRDSFSRLAAPL